jgi:hypothetical protein
MEDAADEICVRKVAVCLLPLDWIVVIFSFLIEEVCRPILVPKTNVTKRKNVGKPVDV